MAQHGPLLSVGGTVGSRGSFGALHSLRNDGGMEPSFVFAYFVICTFSVLLRVLSVYESLWAECMSRRFMLE